MPQSSPRTLFAERALLPDGWARDVRIEIDAAGAIAAVTAGVAADGAERAKGPVVPAVADLHSHAFQRAMAGLAEVAGPGEDNFWTWREAMYRTVGLMTPEDVEVVAAKLFIELMKGGFGAIAEFHYLHNDVDGRPYSDPALLSRRILAAAEATGFGLTLVPVFYAHANFGGVAPNPGQRRFIQDVDGFLGLLEAVAPACKAAGARLGYAFHSLRAATPHEMRAILAAAPVDGPIHIHAAEQTREVDDCLAWSGRRPVEFLLGEMPVDERWCLIHTTHMTDAEVKGLAASGAVAGLCPATEANLGDGIFEAIDYLGAGGRFGVGTDSQVATSVAEELRSLEYSQRLRDRKRNRLAAGPGASVGRRLYDGALAGGAAALGQKLGAIAPGMVASLVVLDGEDPYIAAAEGDTILDRWIFALGDKPVRDVMVAGEWRIRDRRHEAEEAIDRAFAATLRRLAAS